MIDIFRRRVFLGFTAGVNDTLEQRTAGTTIKGEENNAESALPDDCSLEEIAERIEFMAAVQKGLDQLDRGEGIPHDEVKKQLASWLIS